MAGWGQFFGKIAEQFQGRIERLKNEKIKLEGERDAIKILKLDINNENDRKKAMRLDVITRRISDIDKLLASKAS
jgi:hypothetical protein